MSSISVFQFLVRFFLPRFRLQIIQTIGSFMAISWNSANFSWDQKSMLNFHIWSEIHKWSEDFDIFSYLHIFTGKYLPSSLFITPNQPRTHQLIYLYNNCTRSLISLSFVAQTTSASVLLFFLCNRIAKLNQIIFVSQVKQTVKQSKINYRWMLT